MSSDLRRRLERLERGRKRTRARERVQRDSQPQALPPGSEIDTPAGTAYRIDTLYGIDFRHGRGALEEVLFFASSLAAEVASDQGLENSRIRRWGFIDIETTGLSGGAGTLGFLIGLGTFEDEGFSLRQYFLRDPEEEAPALHALRSELKDVEGIVTFNGRTFDVPVLESRYTIALRERWRLSARPHLDLLYPSRRLWSRTLANCRLGTLERQVLEVERTEEDVPGELIPGMYLDYLRTGNASDMARVIYHNAIDILSLVGLSSAVLGRHVDQDPAGLPSGEALAIGRWHDSAGRIPEAEMAYRAAASGTPNDVLRLETLRRLATLLKQQKRRAEAVSSWNEWQRLAPDDPAPCIELAMYYEWEVKDMVEALAWAERARGAAETWPKGWRREQRIGEIEHRMNRLRRKLDR